MAVLPDSDLLQKTCLLNVTPQGLATESMMGCGCNREGKLLAMPRWREHGLSVPAGRATLLSLARCLFGSLPICFVPAAAQS